jgi:hypothetical protein
VGVDTVAVPKLRGRSTTPRLQIGGFSAFIITAPCNQNIPKPKANLLLFAFSKQNSNGLISLPPTVQQLATKWSVQLYHYQPTHPHYQHTRLGEPFQDHRTCPRMPFLHVTFQSQLITHFFSSNPSPYIFFLYSLLCSNSECKAPANPPPTQGAMSDPQTAACARAARGMAAAAASASAALQLDDSDQDMPSSDVRVCVCSQTSTFI